MARCSRLLLVALLLACAAAPVAAQDYNRCNVTAWPDGPRIDYSVDWEMVQPPPAGIVGWTVVRSTLGHCEEDDVILCPTFDFPEGPVVATQWDNDVVPGITYKYRLMGVDTAGDLVFLSYYDGFSPGFRQIGYASLDHAGAVAAGVIVEPATGHGGFITCPDACWEVISFLGALPPDLEPAVGSGVTVLLYGRLAIDFEGPYVAEITGWTAVPPCGIVPTGSSTWGGLKAGFR